MKLTITEYTFGSRPNVPQPDTKFYTFLGENGIRKLVNDHYNLLIHSPVKHLFPPAGKALEQAKQHSADFFIQRLGGPDYYKQNRGNPMLIRRHEPFAITQNARISWLNCYKEILPKLDIPQKYIIDYWNFLDVFSIWMVNTNDVDNP